ncbi:hypothetical protein [Nocardia sp. NPDC057668]|uniref:hypothetical protein n=1 Tax=Nocardia sp. NPDC057668 TaxID=3346202 RepID=UPI00366CEC7A
MRRTAERGVLIVVAGLVFTGLTMHSGAVADPGSCALIGTVGTPELGADETTAGLEAFAPATVALPDRIHFRTATETFNRRWSFTTRDGGLFVKEAASIGGWRAMPLPKCLAGNLTGVSADDDELLAVDRAGRFYNLDRILSAPKDWNWSSRYGTPLWTGPGNALPPGTLDWTWSVLSPNEDHVWRDTAGNDHPVGGAKVSHVFALTDGGTRLRYIDPWLPVDHSYEVGLPGNRFRAVALSTSGSTSLVVNEHGDLYTRLYDFDISGADKVFFRYSYEDQRGRREAPDMLSERVDSGTAAIQLPAPGWVREPKIPGEITDRISIHKTGVGSDARELRVEGRSAGRTGYWTKALTANAWTFVPTDQPLGSALLANTPDDRSVDPSVPESPYDYAGRTAAWSATIESFDLAQTPTPLRLDFGDGNHLDLTLHTVDGLRQLPQRPGISAQDRHFDGTLEVPADLVSSLATQPAPIREFLTDTLAGRRFTDTAVVVTDTGFRVDVLSVTLTRRS